MSRPTCHAIRPLLVVVTAVALLSTGCVWTFETLDGHQNGPHGQRNGQVGLWNSALVYNGRPHVFSWDQDNGDLRHGYWNGSFWAFETLDGNGGPNGRTTHSVGTYNTVTLYNGRPHVFYIDADSDDLRHGYYNGSAWIFETLDGHQNGPNGRLSTGVDFNVAVVNYNGRPHLFYWDWIQNNLRHGYYNGSAWIFETLDGHQNGPNGRVDDDVGRYASATIHNGRPHVFYRQKSVSVDGDLRHAFYNGTSWGFETLDGASTGPIGRVDGDIGEDTAAVSSGGTLRVFYHHDDVADDLRHAWWNGYLWSFETLDGQGGPFGRTTANVGRFNAVVSDAGRPRVFTYDSPNGDLRQAYWNGAYWEFATLDGAGGVNGRIVANVGAYPAPLLDNGRLRVFFTDSTNSNLRHGWFG